LVNKGLKNIVFFLFHGKINVFDFDLELCRWANGMLSNYLVNKWCVNKKKTPSKGKSLRNGLKFYPLGITSNGVRYGNIIVKRKILISFGFFGVEL
jgi:hypothetical protein